MFYLFVLLCGVALLCKLGFVCFFAQFDEGDKYTIVNRYTNFADYQNKK